MAEKHWGVFLVASGILFGVVSTETYARTDECNGVPWTKFGIFGCGFVVAAGMFVLLRQQPRGGAVVASLVVGALVGIPVWLYAAMNAIGNCTR